ncbi:hypothetical protein RclHR1_00360034 [Rhizophagus clarus]|uniref:Tc1-like transposase DDE domain-containing protein n=1 Tax=Rhizophagus clarus TaxID=94130 RepID=A0A2Z6RB78_9GLOM|nr:hypothetical protein RclHR1_00360034 [Rhizophagus clarus]
MPKEFSVDLRWRVVYLYYDDLSTVDIANTLHMSKSIVNKIIKRYNRWACVENPFKGIPGRRKQFSNEDLEILRNLITEKVDWYLDELVYEMECITGKRVSVAALWRSLQYLGITRKKLHKAALERNEIIRAHYLATIGEHYTQNQLIFLDESAKDERKGFVAVDIFEGSCDRKKFVDFVLDQVVPIMNPYPGDNSVIVMDNAKIHHDNELVVLLEELGCRVVFLPLTPPL